MALKRASGDRFHTTIWPGFVDAMTALLMVMMFVVTIFVIVQSLLSDQITSQDNTIDQQEQKLSRQQQQLNQLSDQVAAFRSALTVSEDRETALTSQLADSEALARDRGAQIARLSTQLQGSRAELAQAQSRLTDFEAEVAALVAARNQDRLQASEAQKALQSDLAAQQTRASAAELAIAAARSEIDAQAEEARLAAARREALDAMIAELRGKATAAETTVSGLTSDLTTAQKQLTEAEAARLAEAEVARTLREKLAASDTELTAMTLALEENRKKAEETLTLLAAAESARDEVNQEGMTEAERQQELLAIARTELAQQKEVSAEDQRRLTLLNEQVASLTSQLGALQALLDVAGEDQENAELRVSELGQQLNAALLRAAEEKERRLSLEEQARQKAEDEVRDLARYRSEFFGRLSQILSGREGVRVVGDRFVFQSEVLFAPAEANLSAAGQQQISNVAQSLSEIADAIPPEIDWIIRVDGHTDNQPLSGTGRYRDNWELSQARALAVVRYMIDDLGFAADRLAAAGFSDTRPVADSDTAEGRAQNRRIELKLTER